MAGVERPGVESEPPDFGDANAGRYEDETACDVSPSEPSKPNPLKHNHASPPEPTTPKKRSRNHSSSHKSQNKADVSN